MRSISARAPLALLLALPLLAGCLERGRSPIAESMGDDDQYCQANGKVAVGSPEYVACRKDRDVQRQNAEARTDRRQRDLGEYMMNNPDRHQAPRLRRGSPKEGELAVQRDRIGELDGLRAIAVLIVVIWHYFGTPDGPDGWPWKLLHVGRFGVDLFFILSGYLITDILLRHRTAERYYSAFYGRRAFRIWPLYYLMCAAALIGWTFSLSPDLFDTRGVPGWLYLFGLQNFGMAKAQTDGAYFLAVTWSLAIEEQFYLLFPLLVRNVPPERLFAILLVPILICPIGRLIDSALPDAYGWYVLPQFRIDSLAIGALIAWWRLYRKPDAEVSRRVAAILKWSSLSLPLLWLFGWKRWSVAFSHTQVEIFFGALLFVVLENRGSPKLAILRSSVATFFARTSYAAYLTHHVIVYLLFAVLHEPRTIESLAGISLTFGAFVLTFGLCALSYRYFERPLLDFAHRRFSFG